MCMHVSNDSWSKRVDCARLQGEALAIITGLFFNIKNALIYERRGGRIRHQCLLAEKESKAVDSAV